MKGFILKRGKNPKAEEVKKWFQEAVTYEGEPYTIDSEQAVAVADESKNAIVVARAGSGKTRTIVAKIVYLVAKCGVKPDEIMVFVFNANAAREINARLEKMRVNGLSVMGKKAEVEIGEDNGRTDEGSGVNGITRDAKIATTFHAFSRKIVYEVCGGKEKCGKILADEKDKFIEKIVRGMLKNEQNKKNEMEIAKLASQMTQFINRAQQKYLGGERTLREVADEYLKNPEISQYERDFIEMGIECFKRYHWYLLNKDGRKRLRGFSKYGTDFNLVVSWASKLIASGRKEVGELLKQKKYILVDEYQDFSQLFLAAVMAIRGVAKEAKLFVVGDDWQAINRFAGSEVEYFKEFEKFFPEEARRLTISTNYRCDYEIVDAARRFMKKAMHEKGDFKAFSRRAGQVMLVDPRDTELEYALVDYDERVRQKDREYKMLVRRALGRTPKKATVRYFKTVAELIGENKEREILILHRNNETNIEGASLEKFGEGLKMILKYFGVMNETEFDARVSLMTMHKSKGLEAEVVIILEADEGVIPKMHPDTVLYNMFGETEEVALNDQKRLFYVAMTRAKKRLYIIHNQAEGDGFAKYLKNLQKRC